MTKIKNKPKLEKQPIGHIDKIPFFDSSMSIVPFATSFHNGTISKIRGTDLTVEYDVVADFMARGLKITLKHKKQTISVSINTNDILFGLVDKLVIVKRKDNIKLMRLL